MIKLYSSHCGNCLRAETLMRSKNIPYEVEDNEDIYIKIGEKNGITGMPFADVDGKIYSFANLIKLINSIDGGI